jgi:hypothetical protein
MARVLHETSFFGRHLLETDDHPCAALGRSGWKAATVTAATESFLSRADQP